MFLIVFRCTPLTSPCVMPTLLILTLYNFIFYVWPFAPYTHIFRQRHAYCVNAFRFLIRLRLFISGINVCFNYHNHVFPLINASRTHHIVGHLHNLRSSAMKYTIYLHCSIVCRILGLSYSIETGNIFSTSINDSFQTRSGRRG